MVKLMKVVKSAMKVTKPAQKATKSQKLINKETKDRSASEELYQRMTVSPKRETNVLAPAKEKKALPQKKAAVEEAHKGKKTSRPLSPKIEAAAAKAAKAAAAARLAAEKAAEEAENSQPSDGLVVRYVKRTREEKSLKKAVAEKTPNKTGVEKTPSKRAQEVAVAVPEVLNAVPQAPKPEKPDLKKPAGGGYGVFLKEQRDEISKSVAGQPATAVTKKAGELYKALTDEERKPYHEKYVEQYETYKAAVAEYEKACKLAGHIAETTPAKKRKPDGFVTPVKKPSAVKVSAESVGPLDPDSLHEAKGLGCEEAFRHLTATKVLIEKNVPHDKIVRALRASGGVEKKAFVALRTFYQPSQTY